MNRFVPHTYSLGISVEKVNGEELTLRLPYNKDLIGDLDAGTLHGGVITVLLDQALGVSGLICDSLQPAMAPTMDLRIDHLGVAPAGNDILATARVYRTTRKVLFMQGYAYWDDPDKPIAQATGTWIRQKAIDLSWMDQIDMEDL